MSLELESLGELMLGISAPAAACFLLTLFQTVFYSCFMSWILLLSPLFCLWVTFLYFFLTVVSCLWLDMPCFPFPSSVCHNLSLWCLGLFIFLLYVIDFFVLSNQILMYSVGVYIDRWIGWMEWLFVDEGIDREDVFVLMQGLLS